MTIMDNIARRMAGLEQFLFTNKKSAVIWFVVRLYLASIWLHAGYDKFMNPVWVGTDAGKGIAGFVAEALQKTGGAHPDVTAWYAWFLAHCVAPFPAVWSYVITFGEIAVGLGLLFGVLTALATAGGVLMNFNYLLSGTVSINPVMVLLGVPLLLAWRVSDTIGVQKLYSAMFRKKGPKYRKNKQVHP